MALTSSRLIIETVSADFLLLRASKREIGGLIEGAYGADTTIEELVRKNQDHRNEEKPKRRVEIHFSPFTLAIVSKMCLA